MADLRSMHAPIRTGKATAVSRDQLEKARIRARREGFAHGSANAETVVDRPLEVLPEAKGIYSSEADRFQTDVAGEERARRLAQSEREQLRLQAKRDAALQRDERRWEAMSHAQQQEQKRIESKRRAGMASKKNQGSLPFNPITLEYSNSKEGSLLQHHDDLVRWRSAVRTHNLNERQNGNYNPITGQERATQPPPARPPPPNVNVNASSSSTNIITHQ